MEERIVAKITKKQMDGIVDLFYRDNRKVLKETCNSILSQIWNDVPYFYRDDFESIAGFTIVECFKKYDSEKGDLKGYIYTSIRFAFITYIHNINNLKHGGDGNWDGNKRDENGKRLKKSVRVRTVNIDDRIKEDSDTTYADVIKGGRTVEDIVFQNKKDERLEMYISRLSRTQRKIAYLLEQGYKPNEVQEKLGLTPKQYFDNLTEMKSSENTNVLKGWLR